MGEFIVLSPATPKKYLVRLRHVPSRPIAVPFEGHRSALRREEKSAPIRFAFPPKKNLKDFAYLCILMTDEQYMRLALQEAQRAREEGEVPIGAVVECQGQVIARAHNLTERLTDVTAHAEMQAITAAAEHLGGKYLTDCTLYVTVEPCPMCAGALGWAQVKRIVYGAPDAKRGYRAFAPNVLHPKTAVAEGVLCEPCRALMQDFFRAKRHTAP